VDAEIEHLEQALASPIGDGLVEVVWVREATWTEVHRRLLADEWHVLHFVGHGDYDADDDTGVIALVGADGRADLVEASRFADLLDQAQPAPRLVVLNSCSSGRPGEQDLFSGTAAALARSGISSVVAMQFAISDSAAIAFARGFYSAIARGRDIDEAARSGRIDILGTPGSLEWVTPVLYLRGQVTQLFTLKRTSNQALPVQSTVPHHKVREDREEQQRDVEDQSFSADPRVVEAEFRTDAARREVEAIRRLLQDRNRLLVRRSRYMEEIFNAQGAEAFVAGLQQSLAASEYPYGMQASWAATYRHETRELLVEYELPRISVIPIIESYRYMETFGLVQPRPREESQIRRLYETLIARITLRTLAEAFDAAPRSLVDWILFNGYVSAVDAANGTPVRPLLTSVRAGRIAFAAIALDDPLLDPVACLRDLLNAAVSPHPYDLEEVRPVVQFDLSKQKFVEEMDIVAKLDGRPDLLKLTPVEFEHLIRRLFEAMGMKSWITQSSMEKGVDVFAVDETPIVGGVYVIQVKRYSRGVGLEVVQALAGVLQDRHLAKAILVTTSWVGKTGHDFAARHGGIEIIEGAELKAMLREHLGIEAIISLPKPPSAEH
jgi:restriction system protein